MRSLLLGSLPRGRTLGEESWARRHRAITGLLAAHVPGIALFAFLRGFDLADCVVFAAAVATFSVAARLAEGHARSAAAAATLGLMTCSAIVLHLAGGRTEAKLHFLIVLAVVALYQDWLPFLLSITYVVLHHGVIGAVNPRAVYDHADAWRSPWEWAIVTGGFVVAMSLVNLVSWRLSEQARDRIERLSRHNALILRAAGEGIVGVDADGCITFVNPAASRMLAADPVALIGRPLDETVHVAVPPVDVDLTARSRAPRRESPIASALLSGASKVVDDDEFCRQDGTTFPVEFCSTPIWEDGAITGAVVTFNDITARKQAETFAEQVTQLSEVEQAQREVLHLLQETVRPPMPQVPNTELGVRYEPADPSAPTGGDLYDWYVLPDGTLHIAVVDVIGKGVAATKDALAVTHALRLMALEDRPIEELVACADSLLTEQNPELVATVMLGRYDPATGNLRLAGASHPPALLCRADGTVEEIEAPGIAIGWPGAGSEKAVDITLGRNDLILLYTDGLVEAGKDLADGLQIAADEVSRLVDYPASQVARVIVDRTLSRGSRRDDTLALVLRRRLPPDVEGRTLRPFEHRFQASQAMIPVARHLLEDWLDNQPMVMDEVVDLRVVVSELCTNAVKAARSEVVLRAWTEGDSLVFEVEDDGGGLEWRPSGIEQTPPLDGERGRGLYLVESLADDVTVESDDVHTAVRVVKRAVLPV